MKTAPLLLALAGTSLLAGSMAAGGECRLAVTSSATSYKDAATSFSAGQVTDLHIWATYPRVSQAQVATLRFLTPNGHLYEEQAVPLEPVGSRQQTRAVEGRPFPVPAAKPAKEPKAEAASAEGSSETDAGKGAKRPQPAYYKVGVLRVAGTAVTVNSLYGEWVVQLVSPDETTACKLAFDLAR